MKCGIGTLGFVRSFFGQGVSFPLVYVSFLSSDQSVRKVENMTKRVKGFTANYNGEAIKPGEVMVPFEYTEGDAENIINGDCIKTFKQGGRAFKVVYKAVPSEWEKDAKSALNLIQNEELGHYAVPNSVSMDGARDEYELEFGTSPSVENIVEEQETLAESICFFREKMLLLIEKAPKIGYAVLLTFSGSKGADFSAKLHLGHDGANKVRQVADRILVEGLLNINLDEVGCKRNNYTDIYREEALTLLDEIISDM